MSVSRTWAMGRTPGGWQVNDWEWELCQHFRVGGKVSNWTFWNILYIIVDGKLSFFVQRTGRKITSLRIGAMLTLRDPVEGDWQITLFGATGTTKAFDWMAGFSQKKGNKRNWTLPEVKPGFEDYKDFKEVQIKRKKIACLQLTGTDSGNSW